MDADISNSNGMGKAAAIRLAEAGANIAIIDLNQESGQQLVKELSDKHKGQKFIVSYIARILNGILS